MKLLHWMLMFESNAVVDHSVPFRHTTCSSPFAALTSQKDEEQLSYVAIIVDFSISNEDSNIVYAVYHYCLTAQHLSTSP